MLAIAGNKQDSDPADWRVPHAEASSFAAAVGASHFRTSARTGDGVDALFHDAAQRGLAARSTRSSPPGAPFRDQHPTTNNLVVDALPVVSGGI